MQRKGGPAELHHFGRHRIELLGNGAEALEQLDVVRVQVTGGHHGRPPPLSNA